MLVTTQRTNLENFLVGKEKIKGEEGEMKRRKTEVSLHKSLEFILFYFFKKRMFFY